MKKTKIAAIAAATLMAATAAGALAGCGSDPASTITVMLLANDHETHFYRDYFDDLEEELAAEGLNYTIDDTYVPSSDYYTRLNSNINRSNVPDIFYVRPNDLLQFKDLIVSLEDYAESQNEVDLSDIHETAINMYRFDPATGELGNPEDELYAFPKDLSTQQLGYNKTFLSKFEKEIKAAGLPMPWEGKIKDGTGTYTWGEYKQICSIITGSSERAWNEYAMDVPPIEVIAHSYGGDLIDLSNGKANGTVGSLTSGPIQKAIQYQAELVAAGAHHEDGYAIFTAGRLGFYGLVGSWEIADYNDYFNKDGGDNWGVMPWPTEDGGTEWAGLITSAGYVVSKNCAENAENPQKGDVAKRIAISFMRSEAQNKLVRDEQISLPLKKSVEANYRSHEYDSIYSPSTRGVFLDVVKGTHGFKPAQYSTYNTLWIEELETQLSVMWSSNDPMEVFRTTNWGEIQSRMQTQYDTYKNR